MCLGQAVAQPQPWEANTEPAHKASKEQTMKNIHYYVTIKLLPLLISSRLGKHTDCFNNIMSTYRKICGRLWKCMHSTSKNKAKPNEQKQEKEIQLARKGNRQSLNQAQ